MAKFQHGTSYKEMPSGLKIFAETQTPTVIVGTGTINMGDMLINLFLFKIQKMQLLILEELTT